MALNTKGTDRPILETALGAASLDKLRGHTVSLADTYKAAGGSDPATVKALQDYESKFKSVDLSQPKAALATSGDIHDAFKNWNMSSLEQTKVERAIGHALLGSLEGSRKTLTESYKSLGGNNAQALAALSKVDSYANLYQQQ